jgi:gliding motility-associated-like protein
MLSVRYLPSGLSGLFLFILSGMLTSPAFASVTTLSPPPCEIIESTYLAFGTSDCEGTLPVCIPIGLSEISALDVTLNGQAFTGPFDGCDFKSTLLLNYGLLPGGGQAGPYTLDSWIVNGITFSGEFQDVAALVDSMNVWDPSGNWSLDTNMQTIFGGNQDADYSSLEITQNGSGIVAVLALNSNLIPQGTSIDLPVGSHELYFKDANQGCSDTLTIDVFCTTTADSSILIAIGQIDTICFSTEELPGSLVSIENVCPDQSGEFSVIKVLNDSCLTLLGMEVGLEQACIVLCDDLGICDTTFLSIQVVETLPLPVAVDDSLQVQVGSSVSFPLIDNDLPNSNTFSFQLLTEPTYGATSLQTDGTVTYQADDRDCSGLEWDAFSYELCNEYGCDTARVVVAIFCGAIKVYNGFSPNNDGVNDYFVIEGIKGLPFTYLRVYNRWGVLVFEAQNYQNDWDGRWKGAYLPGGTYFYVLELEGPEALSGYLQIQR